jgi:CheY-like chemotaxis protein
MDGFEVCRRIKSTPSTAKTKIIAMTGAYEADVASRIVEMGAAICLKKPFTPEELRHALSVVGVDL